MCMNVLVNAAAAGAGRVGGGALHRPPVSAFLFSRMASEITETLRKSLLP